MDKLFSMIFFLIVIGISFFCGWTVQKARVSKIIKEHLEALVMDGDTEELNALTQEQLFRLQSLIKIRDAIK